VSRVPEPTAKMPGFPKTILVDTVSFCNLRCSMCPHVSMKRRKGRMEWPLFQKIIDEIAGTSPETRVWLVFFGEALLLKKTTPSIFDMIRYAKEKGLKDVVLNSNGNLLDRSTSEKLIDSKLDGIYIGIDAFSAKTYGELRIGGNYRQTVKNVLDLIKTAKAKKASSFSIQVQFVEMEENRHERDQFVRFWRSQGISVKIRQKLTWSGLVPDEKTKQAGTRHQCYWIMNSLSITDQGDVVLCAADPEGRQVVGDLRRQSISEVWNGRMKELRQVHEQGRWDELPFPCNECNDWAVSYEDKIVESGGRSLLQRLLGRAKRALQRSQPACGEKGGQRNHE